MTEKTPRERLFETLEKNARDVAAWPAWMRSAISTAHVFQVSPAGHDSRGEACRVVDGARAERKSGT